MAGDVRRPLPWRSTLAVLACFATLAWAAACGEAADAFDAADLGLAARDSGAVNAEPVCARCTVAFDTIVILGGADDPASVNASFASWAVDSRGRYFSQVTGHEVFVYDSTGRFQRSLARLGSGPGELPESQLTLRTGPGDTLRLVGGSPPRVHVFGPDLDFVRSTPLAPDAGDMAMAAYLPGPGLLVGPTRGRDGSEDALVVADQEGRTVRTFAPIPGRTPMDFRWVVAAPDGTLWSFAYSGWQIDNWSADGERLRSFHASMPWQADGRNTLSGMGFDEEGRLYLFGLDRSEAMTPAHGGGFTIDASAYSTWVEVLDVPSGTLLARSRFPGRIAAAPWGAGTYAIVESPTGDARIQILRPRLVNE